jgi:hypothetical protein
MEIDTLQENKKMIPEHTQLLLKTVPHGPHCDVVRHKN